MQNSVFCYEKCWKCPPTVSKQHWARCFIIWTLAESTHGVTGQGTVHLQHLLWCHGIREKEVKLMKLMPYLFLLKLWTSLACQWDTLYVCLNKVIANLDSYTKFACLYLYLLLVLTLNVCFNSLEPYCINHYIKCISIDNF